ncbi:MAG: hypothetical protein RI922_2162 [Bacteroidota bacterium]
MITEETTSTMKRLENDQVIVILRGDGIVHVSFLPNTEITVEFQQVLLNMYNEVTGGKKSLFIFDGGEFVSITKDARENAVAIEETTPTKASAIVVKNLAQKIIADFYYKVNRPKQPYKVFWQFDKAIEWLLAIRD